MLHRSIVASFSGGPSPRPTAKTTRGEGRGARRFSPRALAFPSSGPAKNIPLESPGKGKGELFTLGLPYPCSQRPKKRELSPAAGSASATSTASCSRPLEPDTGIFPGEPIRGIYACPRSVLAGICAGSKACNKGPERSCIEFVGPEKTRRRIDLCRRSYRFSAKGGNCL